MRIIFDKYKELERIIELYQNQLVSFAFYRVGSYAVAQHIVQDTFLRFYENMRIVQRAKNIKTYLYRSIANACIDYKRKYAKNTFTGTDLLNNILIDEQDEHACLAEHIRIEDMLKDLPEEQAEILKMKFVDDLNFVEIAKIIETNVNTVKSRYKYAIEKLKKNNIINYNYYENTNS
jgi:RNA polymerase sigma-70 factor (ECF subfamily)